MPIHRKVAVPVSIQITHLAFETKAAAKTPPVASVASFRPSPRCLA
jgi:hypothetical protein